MESKHQLRQEPSLTTGTGSHAELRQAETVFATPEEILQFDRSSTELPRGIEDRLGASLQAEAAPESTTPWWRRWLGGAPGH